MRTGLIACLLVLGIAAPAVAREAPQAASPATREIAYGAQPLQRLDFHAARAKTPAPLIVFVHGGGWKRGDKSNATGPEKIAHFLDRGYAFASVNYRLVPGARVEDQAQDVSDAIAYLAKHARELGVDAARIVVIGHSAGAHLAALVATDPSYMRKAGFGFDKLAGVVLLDGAAYNVPEQMREGPRIMRRTYAQAFGSEEARQRRLSPTLQAAAPNAPAFLILHVDRVDGERQSEALAHALRAARADVMVEAIEGRGLQGHMAINRSLGDTDYPATAAVDAWLDRVLGRRQ